MGNLRLYGSTSGYTELAPPAVAPDGVLSLPSGTGTLALAADNKVLQVVRATDSTNRTTTSTSLVDVTGMSVTITPRQSTSAVIVMSSFFSYSDSISGAAEYAITDSSNVALSGAQLAQLGAGAASSYLTVIGYSTPATTSAITYKLRFMVNGSGTNQILNAYNTGQMYAIEVAA